MTKSSSAGSAVPESNYPGERLGLPEEGPGSVARFGMRIFALVIDWGLAAVLAWWIFDYAAFAVSAIFIVLTSVCIALLGSTIGHLIFGMRVNTIRGEAPGWWRPWVRQVLLSLVIPAIIMDSDQRGAHEVLTGLVLRRFR
ncbi:RDD family protein [Gulosibacter chungangensis]|uniref:RDD family protein n=1 Tax=Gulosibacter chungangensis TaxID=979746 RepID=A0A7J5BEV3_9MICO|nr:RDD family protein [Gulosibacter chungangensis]KAB1644184.1 RDD family protein [Gulosibacter chungangensis]